MTCPFGQWLGANEATDPNPLGEVMADLADCWARGTLWPAGAPAATSKTQPALFRVVKH